MSFRLPLQTAGKAPFTRITMIIYELQCQSGHQFEGWFPNAQAFEKQLQHGLVSCTVCGISDVRRIPAGGHSIGIKMASHSAQQSEKKSSPTTKQSDQQVVLTDPVTLAKAAYHFVKKYCKDVGSQFAEKAIAIQRGEAPPEPISGTASASDIKRLNEEDVAYTLLPKLPEQFEN